MGAIDSFLQTHVSSGLEPGETIQGMGHIRQPYRFNKLLGVPEAQTEHLAVATDRRLIIFTTELGGVLTPVLKPIATPPVFEWRYEDLAQVVLATPSRPIVHSGGAVVEMTLIPHPFSGPFAGGSDDFAKKRYDIYRAADGLDAQGAFFAQFPAWLKGAVEGGRFPLPPAKREAIAAKQAAAAAEQAAAAAEQARKMKAAGAALTRHGPPVAVAVVTLIVAITCVVWGVGAADRISSTDEQIDHATRDLRDIDEDLKWLRAGLPPPARCDAKEPPSRVQYDHATGLSSVDENGWPNEFGCGCRKVRLRSGKPSPPAGWKAHLTSYAWHYECPPVATFEASRVRRVDNRESAEERHVSAIVQVVVASVSTLGALVGGLVAFLVLKRRAAAQ